MCVCSPASVHTNKWSHYIGVVWDTSSSLWQARFTGEDGAVKDLGKFAEQDEAAVAYDRHAWDVVGAPGLRNNPPSHYTGKLCSLHDMAKLPPVYRSVIKYGRVNI